MNTEGRGREEEGVYLAINRCPKHPAYWSIAIEDEGGSGTRLTPTECCGSWSRFKRWKIEPERLLDDIAAEVNR